MPTSTARATMIGFSAVLMWSTLSSLVMLSGQLPPFFATGAAFTVAFGLSVAHWVRRGDSLRSHFRLPLKIWALGVFGMFGFHFFYFIALKNAPPVEALLLINLWPLLILLFSVPILKRKIGPWHVLGALLGFSGACVIALARSGGELGGTLGWGHAYAVACGFIWSLFSVLCRKWEQEIPKDAIGVFCGVSAALCLACHALSEPSVSPAPMQWLWLGLMGVFPMGLAFYTWDYGVKHGDIALLGVLAYLGTLLGVTFMITLGFSPFTWQIGLATLLIVGGASLGSVGPMLQRKFLTP